MSQSYASIPENNSDRSRGGMSTCTATKFHRVKANAKSIDRVSLIVTELVQQVDKREREKEREEDLA